ncbi:PREDICTED: peritrophin-48-like, partial [Drosophila arizonae]|uniref:Peritrophin-48-like n=1 Tax=Drosophila arizonae TaxID=7263 RepID=A0ABM1NNY5_DROAR
IELKFVAGIYLLACILCLAVGSSLGVILEGNYNVTSVCTLVKAGTQLGSIESCDYYYVCTPNGPVQTYCQAGYAYDYKAQTCSPSSQVQCYYGVQEPCSGITEGWVPVENTCNQWIYCKNGVAGGRGSCGELTFSAQLQRCTAEKCNILSEGDGVTLNNICQVVPPNIYFGDPYNCTKYQFCYPDGSYASGYCTTSAFIVSSQRCGYDTNGACDRIQQGGLSESCDTVGATRGDPNVCGSYQVCNGKTYELKNCPSGQYFNVATSTCLSRQSAVPEPGCNRCQYATTPFVNAISNDNCNTYYHCNNGANGNVTSCPADYFFNELEQGCVQYTGNSLQNYGSVYPACAGATAPATTTAPAVFTGYRLLRQS